MDEKRAHHRLTKMFPAAHFQRIESWTGAGIFDTNACQHGVEAWIECKEARKPKTLFGKIKAKVKPEQVAWEFCRRRAGGRTFVALMVGNEMFILRGMDLIELKEGVTQQWLKDAAVSPNVLFGL